MGQDDLLRSAVIALEDAGIRYYVTGSYVSSAFGIPRSTHDVDIVVEPAESLAATLLPRFPPPTYYLDATSVGEAVRRRGSVNVIDVPSGDKLDLWVAKDTPHERSAFERRMRAALLPGLAPWVASPEDSIISKLGWAKKLGGSEQQRRDVLGVYEVQGPALDLAYIERWVKELRLEALWEEVKLAAAKRLAESDGDALEGDGGADEAGVASFPE